MSCVLRPPSAAAAGGLCHRLCRHQERATLGHCCLPDGPWVSAAAGALQPAAGWAAACSPASQSTWPCMRADAASMWWCTHCLTSPPRAASLPPAALNPRRRRRPRRQSDPPLTAGMQTLHWMVANRGSSGVMCVICRGHPSPAQVQPTCCQAPCL